jgi:hypothetical protein
MVRSSKRKEPPAAVGEVPKDAAAAPPTAKRTKEAEDVLPAASAVPPTAAATDTSKPSPKKRVPITGGINKSPVDAANFHEFLFFLISFKADKNNFHVTKDEDSLLHAFLQHLKKEYKAYQQDPNTSILDEDQIKVLEFLHIPLTSRGDEHWNRFYDLLLQYKETHKHVLVPRLCEIPGLGDWCTDQRRQHKAWKQGQPSQLTQARREKLEAIGFVWQVRNRPEWEHRYQELVDYKSNNDDCKVPQHYKENRALGKWVAKQREQYKLMLKGQHSFLTPYRLEKLNDLGFVWQVRTALDTDTDDAPVVAAAVEATPAPVEAAPVPESETIATGATATI